MHSRKQMLQRTLFAAALLLVGAVIGFAPSAAVSDEEGEANDPNADLRDGKNFIPTRVYSEEEDQRLLKLYEGLKVADVTDGMDAVGLTNVGLMSPEIGPLHRDFENLSHQFVGIAVTARYVPANDPPASPEMSVDEYDQWVGRWYSEQSPEPFTAILREGSALVIEDAESVDVGTIGSNNILHWKEAGAVGVVTSATARDTDEIAAQGQIPLYYKGPGRGIRPGRNEIESVNRPVTVGGVQVRPGDVIIADGDGVICVPRERAVEVAEYAHGILEGRQEGRRELYERLGIEPDRTLETGGE